MVRGFSLIPEDVRPVSRGRQNSVYRQLLTDALRKFEADPNLASLRVGIPPDKKFMTVYSGLRDRLSDPEFVDKMSIRGIGGTIYIVRGPKKAANK